MADSDEADKILVPKDRTFERTQGCWNCIHATNPKAFWNERRPILLTRATSIALNSKLGEGHPKVVNIRHMVDTTDRLVAAHTVIKCGSGLLKPGKTANGEPVGDLVASNYLCGSWTGAQGASVARAGQAADPLPEELADKVGNALPDPDRITHDLAQMDLTIAKPDED